MEKLGRWSEKTVSLIANNARQIKAASPINVVMIQNTSTVDYVYLGFDSNISANAFETKIGPGQWGVLARPHEFHTYYLFCANNLNGLKQVEARVTEPLGFVQRIIYGGQITESIITSTVGLKASELNLETGTKNLLVKNVKTGRIPKIITGTINDVEEVKNKAGVVFQLSTSGGAKVEIYDDATQVWGEVTEAVFYEGLKCEAKIKIKFKAAGVAYILYD